MPYGLFCYIHGPMGFAATGNAFCLCDNNALQGVINCMKVMDDILVYDMDYLTVAEVITPVRKGWEG